MKVHVLNDFDDAILRRSWEPLLRRSPTDAVFLACEWQRTWWEVFGRGQLLLIAVERADEIVAIAPLFADSGMVYFVGSGGSDYLDFIGDVSDRDVLASILAEARKQVPDFVGFLFFHVLENSATPRHLEQAAGSLGLGLMKEGEHPAPALGLSGGNGLRAIHKKSLVRHEQCLRRSGPLDVIHLEDGNEILPHLESFFAQHRTRWEATPHPSLFLDPAQQRFYRRLAIAAASTGWLRFTRLDWEGRPIAFHYGFCYRGSYLWYKPSFNIALARRSPGEVLLRQLLLAAIAERAHTFDFGLGAEAFKSRFATQTRNVANWGLYPRERA